MSRGARVSVHDWAKWQPGVAHRLHPQTVAHCTAGLPPRQTVDLVIFSNFGQIASQSVSKYVIHCRYGTPHVFTKSR
jgi:hypothetical protein